MKDISQYRGNPNNISQVLPACYAGFNSFGVPSQSMTPEQKKTMSPATIYRMIFRDIIENGFPNETCGFAPGAFISGNRGQPEYNKYILMRNIDNKNFFPDYFVGYVNAIINACLSLLDLNTNYTETFIGNAKIFHGGKRLFKTKRKGKRKSKRKKQNKQKK